MTLSCKNSRPHSRDAWRPLPWKKRGKKPQSHHLWHIPYPLQGQASKVMQLSQLVGTTSIGRLFPSRGPFVAQVTSCLTHLCQPWESGSGHASLALQLQKRYNLASYVMHQLWDASQFQKIKMWRKMSHIHKKLMSSILCWSPCCATRDRKPFSRACFPWTQS